MAGSRFGAAFCAATLVVQAALLPVLHAGHGALAMIERVLAFAAPVPDSGAMAITSCDRAAAPASDPASCPVCATFGRAGAALAPVASVPGALPAFAGVLGAASAIATAAPDISRGAPRGPPALVS